MKISVIIPVHNAERFLRECLDSVLGQTLREIEVIAVDDGSVDGSPGILAEYAVHDARIRVLTQENAGAGSARNHAIAIASGDYLSFMDSDDRYPEADTLERMLQSANEAKALICGGGLVAFGGPSEALTAYAGADWVRSFMPPRRIEAKDYPCCLGFTRFLYHRELFTDGTVRFPAYAAYEDPVFFAKALAKAGWILGLDFQTYSYRIAYRRRPDWSGKDLPRVKDSIRGMTETMAISHAGGLDAIGETVKSECFGPLLEALVGSRRYDDSELFLLLCKLNLALGCDRVIPALAELQHVAGRCSTVGGSLLHAVLLAKGAVGRFLPDWLKFWKRGSSSDQEEGR